MNTATAWNAPENNPHLNHKADGFVNIRKSRFRVSSPAMGIRVESFSRQKTGFKGQFENAFRIRTHSRYKTAQSGSGPAKGHRIGLPGTELSMLDLRFLRWGVPG